MNTYSPVQKVLAWSVHLFTASGLVAGFMAILAINEMEWRNAMLWLMVCLVIDGVDGTFARLFKVKEVLPNMDGKIIDYVIDFATYAIIPAYFFHEANLVEDSWRMPCTAIILLVSALYYGKDGMVSNDMYFIGFPVLWNMVVFFLFFVFDFASIWNGILIIIFAILHFVPVKFVYPSQATKFKTLTLINTVIFIGASVAILWIYPERNGWIIGSVIVSTGYYAVMAIFNTWIEK
jgi:phosphatidylcholine synthase